MKEIIIILFGILFGVLPTVYVIWEFVATVSQKVYRKIKYGISLFD